jgi:hypothetical protein
MKTLHPSTGTKPVYRLPTQEKRAAFVRKAMRERGLSIDDLAGMAELWWNTVAAYAGLTGNWGTPTRDPRTDTTRKIFRALGYDLCFTSRESKGIVEL